MKFSPDTSRLVPGRHYWWTYDARETPSTTEYEGPETALPHHLWGDEVIPPTVEVEPSPPAWVPPVCPAGQVYTASGGVDLLAISDRHASGYPPPAWPPRIGEIVEVRPSGEDWIPAMVTTGLTQFGGVVAGLWQILPHEEGRGWRWVYRDLSGYVPPGGGQ
jgi:hypothetical protein